RRARATRLSFGPAATLGGERIAKLDFGRRAERRKMGRAEKQPWLTRKCNRPVWRPGELRRKYRELE
ncbi:MAG: hypothetical protein ACP5QA_16660, partial [Phycisphaerae bacterium]